MSSRVIDRAEWVDYVDAFSRRHDGWLVSVAVEEASNPRRYLARDVALRGVVAELDDIRRPRLHITWSFLLEPTVNGGTRLVLRYRGLVHPRLAELPLYALLDAGEFVMTRRMLLGIRERAERRHAIASSAR